MTEGIAPRVISNPDGTLRAYDGRQIGYGEFGDPEGKPVVLCHGFGDSRLTRNPDDELTARLGIRLITLDRPGIGLTDPMKELTLIDRVRDIEELANALKLDRFAVLGWSGGAPFALATAYELGDRVTRVGIAAGFGPFERTGFRRLAPKEIRRVILILKAAPWMSGMLAKESAKQLQGDTHTMSNGDGLASSSDASMLARGQVRQNISRGAEEAFRQGHEGVAADMLLVFRFKWGFRPEDVEHPVELWYGDEDRMTPVEVGRGLASLLPDARLRVSPGAGHLLHIKYWEDILQTLTGERKAEVRAAVPWVQAAVAEPVATAIATAAPQAPEPAAVEPEAAEPVAATVAAPPGEDAGSDTTVEVAAEADALVTEAQLQAPAAPIETPAAVRPTPVVPAVPALAEEERERLRAAGFLIEEEEPAAAAAVSIEEEEPAAAAVSIEEEVPAAEEPAPKDVSEVTAAPAVAEAAAEAAYVDEAVPEAASAAWADDLASVEPAAGTDEEAAEVAAAAAQPEMPSLDADELQRLRAAGFLVSAAEPTLEVAEAIVEATAVAEPEVPIDAAETEGSVEGAVTSSDEASTDVSADASAEAIAAVHDEMVAATVVAESDLPIEEATSETVEPVYEAVTSSEDAEIEPSIDTAAEATEALDQEPVVAAAIIEAEVLVEAAVTPSDAAEMEQSADTAAEATAGVHEEMVEAATVAESELPIEATADSEPPVEAATSSNLASTDVSADAEATAGMHEEMVDAATVAESELPFEPTTETDVPIEVGGASSEEDLAAPEANSGDTPAADAGAPETEPAASDDYDVLRAAGFFVEEPEGDHAVPADEPEDAEEAEQSSHDFTSRVDVQDRSEAAAETQDARGEANGAGVADAAPIDAASAPADADATAANPEATAADAEATAANPEASAAEAEATGAEGDATPQGNSENADLMRADELTQRLDELADRYAVAAEENRSDDDGGDEASDDPESAAIAMHEDVEDVVKDVVNVIAESPSAVAAGTLVEPDRADEVLEAAVAERRFDDIEPAGAASEAPSVDPMLERLRAAGFSVMDAVQSGGR